MQQRGSGSLACTIPMGSPSLKSFQRAAVKDVGLSVEVSSTEEMGVSNGRLKLCSGIIGTDPGQFRGRLTVGSLGDP